MKTSHRRRNPRRAAFTLVELLVVVAIVGLSVAFLLPAVQAARETSRRAECLSRLGQIGRALNEFQSANKRFPPAYTADEPKPGSFFSYFSPHDYLLPYVEQGVVYAKIDWHKSVAPSVGGPLPDVGESSVARLPMAIFACPSDPNHDADSPSNSFRFCTGPSPYARDDQSPAFSSPAGANGPFTLFRGHAPAEFPDGLSNTVGASEKVIGAGLGYGYSRLRDFWYSGVSNLGTPLPGAEPMRQVCSSLVATPPVFFPLAGQTWFYAGYEFTWYNHVVGPNAATPDCSVLDAADSTVPTIGGVFRADSYHPGGVNAALMDGSARFFSNDVALPVWRALATRAEGDSTDLDGA